MTTRRTTYLRALLPVMILLCFSPVAGRARRSWYSQNPPLQGNVLNDVEFTSAATGTAVGSY